MSYPTGFPCSTNIAGTKPADLRLPADGAWRTHQMVRSGSVATSTARGTAGARARLVSDARGTTQLELRTANAASLTPTGPSTCGVSYGTRSGAVALDVAVPRRSWLVVRSTVASSRGELHGQVGAGTMDGTVEYFTAPGGALTRLVPPGYYGLGGEIESETGDVPAGSTTPRSASSSVSTLVAFYPVGTRRSLTGEGRRFVAAGHRNCTTNEVRVAFTSAARTRTRQITFYVNGVRRVVLRGRALQRSSLVLKRIAPGSAGVVKAVVRTKSGARRTMTSTSWPCR